MAEGAVLGLSDSVDQQILQAVVQGDVQELAILLRNFGKDPSSIIGKKGRTPLHFGCLNGNAACVTLLLTIVQTVDSEDAKHKTPLALAAKRGFNKVIELLLARGANLNTRDENGNTPIHQASYHGQKATVELLVKHGAQPNVPNDIESAPLHFAAMCGHHGVCEALIQAGADVNMKNKNATTPLHLAARNGYVECCKILIKASADVNSVDPYNQIPLHLAARTGHYDCLQVMLEDGAEVNAQDMEGNTPFDWADDYGHGECAVLLWRRGAQIKTQTGKQTMQWRRPWGGRERPTMRYDHAMTALGSSIYMFGGYGISPQQEGYEITPQEGDEPMALHMSDLYVLKAEGELQSLGTIATAEDRRDHSYALDLRRIGENLVVAEDGLTVEYVVDASVLSPSKPAVVKTSTPIRRIGDETLFYFEITVLDQGLKGYIAVGLTDVNYPLNKQPGWVKHSYGYHGDDGMAYHNQGSGIPFGPRFGTGDTVGCGLIYETGEVFFTKNGKFLGVGYSNAQGKELFPSVGLHSSAEKVVFNLGKKPFKFNFEAEVVEWTALNPRGQEPEGRSASHLLPFGSKLLLFGGYSPVDFFDDVHVLDTDTMVWSEMATKGPLPRYRDVSVSICMNKLVVFGGRSASRCVNFVYFLDLATWEWENVTAKIEGDGPRARMAHASAVVGDKVYIFGGVTAEKQLLNDIHILDVGRMQWSSPQVYGRPPTARQNATVTPVDKRLYVFGGWDGRRQHNDMHVFDTERLAWYKPHVSGTVPRPRNHHTAAALNVDGRQQLYFFAGWNGRGYMEDLDCLDLQSEESEELLSACNQPDFHDITFWVAGKPIYAHKVILASRSSYLRSMLTTGEDAMACEEEQRGAWEDKSEVVLTDVTDYSVFLAFIHFLYTDIADATTEMIGALLAVTEKYGKEHIERMSEYLILTRLKTPSSLYKNLRWAFNNPRFSDVRFLVRERTRSEREEEEELFGGHLKGKERDADSPATAPTAQRVYGHKVVVCGRSPYFKALLLGGLKETSQEEIVINPSDDEGLGDDMAVEGEFARGRGSFDAVDAVTSSAIRYAIFTSLMKYLYTDEMELENDEDRLDLLVLANLYSVESLKKLIEDDLMQSLDFENVSCLFALADTANALNLRRKCLHFITENENTLQGIKLTWSYMDLSGELKEEIARFWATRQAQ